MSLFILSSERKTSLVVSRATELNIIQEQVGKLIRIGELAYARRKINTMEHVGRELMKLHLESAKCAGMYYLAMSARRQGKRQEARILLTHVAQISYPKFQARAIQALGTIEHEEGRPDEALHLYLEAARIARNNDTETFINSWFQFSAIKSFHGDHKHALLDLESLWPLVRVAAKQHPYLWPALHNEIACEMLELGRIGEAAHASSIALASPFAVAYPEWQETGEEIKIRGYRSHSVMALAGRQADSCVTETENNDQAVDVIQTDNILHHDWSAQSPIVQYEMPAQVEFIADRILEMPNQQKEKGKTEKPSDGQEFRQLSHDEKEHRLAREIFRGDLLDEDLEHLMNELNRLREKSQKKEGK